MSEKRPPVVLCVLDGLGVRDESKGNVFQQADTPALDDLFRTSTTLVASGSAVGLPERSVGNGEVGHMTLGAGRVVETTRARFDKTLAAGKLGFVPMIDQTVRICLYDECPIHMIGVIGEGGVHADMNHLYPLIETFDFNDVPIIIHAILDGRDTAPRAAMASLDHLQGYIEDKKATIGTVMGRHYAMDQNERWDRTYKAFHAIVRDRQLGPAALEAETPYDAIAQANLRDLDDDVIEPTRIGDYRGINGDYLCDFSSSAESAVWEWTGLDAGLVFNHRPDGIRQLVAMLSHQDLPDYVSNDLLMDRQYPVRAFREHCLATITSFGDAIRVPVAFPAEPLPATLGEVLAKAGLRQLRCGESEKRMHVTTFFSGGREEPFDGESRKIVRSPRLVDTYDDKPEMSAAKVADAVLEALSGGEVDFIVANFANLDMVPNMDAAKRALVAVDAAVARIREGVRERKGALLITSDHGGCERRIDDGGERSGANTANPVPFAIEAEERPKLREGGSLCDVAPTVLDLFGIDKPEVMTGASLTRPGD